MNFLTRTDVNTFLLELEKFSQALYRPKLNADFSLDTKFASQLDDYAHLLEHKGYTELEKVEYELFIKKVKDEVDKLQFIELTLSFDPDEPFVHKLGRWVSENVDTAVLLDLKTDPKILGGVQIGYKGFYKDLSALRKFDNYYERNIQQISQ